MTVDETHSKWRSVVDVMMRHLGSFYYMSMDMRVCVHGRKCDRQ